MYLIAWDFGKDARPSGSFYRLLAAYGRGVSFLQKSVVLTNDRHTAYQLRYLCERHGAQRVNVYGVTEDGQDSTARVEAEAAVEAMLSQRLRRRGRRAAAG